MKKLMYLLFALPLIWSCKNGGGASAESADLKTFIDSASYAQGVFMASQFEKYTVEGEDPIISPYQYAAGLEAGMAKEAIFDQDQATEILNRYQTYIQEAGVRRGKTRGQAFQKEYKSEDGVQETASGLLYKVIEPGTGATPTPEDIVQVHYEGRFVDGEVFDGSIGGPPAQFKVGAVVKGWIEGLQLMKEGAKYQFVIPADLAYGDVGNPRIGPGETLVFDLELIKVNP